MTKNLILTGLLSMAILSPGSADAQGQRSKDPATNAPRQAPNAPYAVPARIMEPKNVPDFATGAPSQPAPQAGRAGTVLQVGAESTTLPVQTKLKLVLEYPVDARTSQPGDIFEAHVKDDLFVGRSLLLPRGSLIRGRVSAVVKPRLISRAAKIGLKLEQITTPIGEVIPLDAALEFQKGLSNQRGEFDPGTNFGTRVESGVRTVTGLNSTGGTRGALMAANIATVGAPAVAALIGGSAVALFRTGDNVSLQPGQEIEILLTNDLGLQIN